MWTIQNTYILAFYQHVKEMYLMYVIIGEPLEFNNEAKYLGVTTVLLTQIISLQQKNADKKVV